MVRTANRPDPVQTGRLREAETPIAALVAGLRPVISSAVPLDTATYALICGTRGER
jgi:hypothetical protein